MAKELKMNIDLFSDEYVHYDKKVKKEIGKRVGLSISRETMDLEKEYAEIFKVDPPRANIYRNALKSIINKNK